MLESFQKHLFKMNRESKAGNELLEWGISQTNNLHFTAACLWKKMNLTELTQKKEIQYTRKTLELKRTLWKLYSKVKTFIQQFNQLIKVIASIQIKNWGKAIFYLESMIWKGLTRQILKTWFRIIQTKRLISVHQQEKKVVSKNKLSKLMPIWN